MSYVWDVVSFDDRSFYSWEIVSLVEADVLRVIWPWSFDHDAVEGLFQRLHVVYVRAVDHGGERGPPRSVRMCLLTPSFARSVGSDPSIVPLKVI